MVNWQLLKQGICWPVSCDHIAGSGLDLIEVSCFLKLTTVLVFDRIIGSSQLLLWGRRGSTCKGKILVWINSCRLLTFLLTYSHVEKKPPCLRWLNTVFDTCVHSPLSLKPLIPRSPKMAASKLTTQTLVFWWLGWRMCRCHGNMTRYKQAFKISFVYL